MSEFVPQVSHEDVVRIVGRDYPSEDRDAILDILSGRASDNPEDAMTDMLRTLSLSADDVVSAEADALPTLARPVSQ